MTNVDALVSLLGDAEKTREFAVVRLQGGTAPRRERLASNFAAVALELHRGLCCLLYYKLLTAAFALERPMTETVIRALWIGFCADEAAMDRIRDDDPKAYPYWAEMQKQVETELGVETNEAAARDTWKRLCGATHTGIGHLRNHVGGSGMLGPQFTDAEAQSLLRVTTGFVLSLFILQMTQMGREALNWAS